MVFHLGALIRLNEAGMLRKLKLISSVSGGSVSTAMLGLKWSRLKFAGDVAMKLARTPTRLKRLEPGYQERPITWGYAVCDAALRRHINPKIPRPAGFPYPAGVRVL